MLSKRSNLLTASATLAMNALAKERKAKGLPVYNLSTGEPDYPTPTHIKTAAIKAIQEDFTYYTAAGGINELKTAIQKKFHQDLNQDFALNEITCSNGGKQILYNLFQIILNPDDEVICPEPYWLSYKTQVELAEGKFISAVCSKENNFKISTQAIATQITSKTKAIILNSPCNPTGSIIEESELKALAELALKEKILIISDDVYEFFYFTKQKPKHILELKPELKNQTIIVNSVSKTYAMTGWRLGYAAGPEAIIQKMEELQSHSSSNPSSISQKAALAALSGSQEQIEVMREHFLKRRNFLIQSFKNQDRIQLIEPKGAFYAMIDISKLLKKGETDLEFCQNLLAETGVTVVPGSPFGNAAKNFVRLSFAVKDEILEKTVEILLEFRK